MLKKHVLIAILLTLISFISAARLIPDTTTPLIMTKPTTKESNTKITLKFKFANNSKGLLNKQVLAVSFPKVIGTNDALFNLYNIANTFRYSCELYYNNVLIQTSPVIYNPSLINYQTESNVAYCLIDDAYNTPLIPSPSKNLVLNLYLSQITISSLNFIRNLEIFTATSAGLDKVIIDSYNNFGSLALYGDPITPPALEITAANSLVTKGPGPNKIHVLNTFDITLSIKCNSFISSRDSVFTIRFPSEAVSAPTGVSTSANDPLDAQQQALKAEKDQLTLSSLSTDTVSISGVNEDLVIGRQFKLTLKNFTALSAKASNKNIELIIYYVNSYSQISYSANACFTISLIELENLSIAHPELDKVFSGHAYPFDFTFSVNTEINSPALVSFQHSKALDSASGDGGARLNFLAATCDFSMNGSFNTYFGQRPKCYPMRLDFNYPSASTAVEYLESGIVFKVNSLTAKMVYKVRVWIVFDDCGTTSNPLLLESQDNKLNPFVEFKFNFKIYKYVKSNKKKLDYDTGTAYVETLDIVTKTPCWQSSKNEVYTTDDKNGSIPAGDWRSSEITESSNKGIVLVKEINNFDLMETFQVTGGNADYSYVNNSAIRPIYTNNPTADFSTRNNYLMLKTDFKLPRDDSIYKYFPLNLSYSASSNSFSPIKGTLEFRFSRNWLKIGNYEPNRKACWVSWGFKGAASAISNLNLYPSSDTNDVLKTKKNLIYIGKEVSATSTVNLSTLILPNSSGSDMLRIASKHQENQENFDFTTGYDYRATDASNPENISFLLYSNCVAINDKPPQIKSIYSYFEGYINWIYSKSELDKKYTIRVIRYLKLFPSLGFFNELSTDNRIPLTNLNSLFKFHYINSKNQDVNSICILEVSAETLKLFQDKIPANTQNSFIFQMNMYNLSLLDTDYENIALDYPMMQSFKDEKNENYAEISSDYYQSGLTLNSINKSYAATLKIDSTKGFKTDNNSKLITYAYMSANVRILNLKKIPNRYGDTNTYNDILIPTSCPIRKLTETSDYKIFSLPVFTSFLYSYDVFGSLNKNFIYATFNAASDADQNVFLLPNTKKYKTHSVQYSTLRFSKYSVTDTVNLNILFGTNFSKSEYTAGRGDVNCSAMSLLLNSDIELDKENIQLVLETRLDASKVFYSVNKSYLNSNYFYLNKIGFNKLLIGISTTSITTTKQNNNNASVYPASPSYVVKGVKRPTVDSFVVNVNNKIYFNYTDKIGFACVGITDTDYYATNYVVYKEQNNNVANFILDLNQDNSNDWSYTFRSNTKNSVISLDDNNSSLYLDELSGNFKLNVYLPIAAPNGALFKMVSVNNFNKNTLCGIVNTIKNNLVNDCYTLNNLTTQIYCPIYAKSKSDIPTTVYDENINPNIYLSLCCYNVSVKNKIAFSSLEVSLDIDPSVNGLSNFLGSSYLKDNLSVKDFSINTQTLPSLSKLNPITIKGVSYLYSNHEGALAKLRLQISFPREIIRNSKIILSTSAFASMQIPNSIMQCSITNSEESNKIDPYIESCTVNFQDSLRTVIIKFKKVIYSCGVRLPSGFNVVITPVKAINLLYLTYKINWFLDETGDNIGNLDANQTFPSIDFDTKVLKKTPYLGERWANLCNIIKIFPHLISEYAYYDFELNTVLLNSSPENFNLNELSLFFPTNFYLDENLSNLFCEVVNFPNILCKCQLDARGIVSVKFSQSIFNPLENPRVRVIGLQNPGIESEYLAIPCTLNNISHNKSDPGFNSRYNILTGTGILKGGLNNNISRMGNIRLFNSKSLVSDLNPRSRGSYIFKLSFDFSSGITLPLTITNNPLIIINFPEQYSLFKYAFSTSTASVSITATIEEIIQGENNLVTSNGCVSISKISVINNSLHLYLSESTRTIPLTLRFWQIRLNYVPAPSEPVLTGTYGLVLTNLPNTIYIENFTNADTLFSEVADKSSVDPFIPYLRGVGFYFDNIKIILDVFDKTAPASNTSDPNNNSTNTVLYNYVILKPGFFKDIQIVARSEAKSFQSAITQITLEDSVFITDQDSYQFSTSNPVINLRLGAPCNTLKGVYYLNFKVENTQKFLEMSPVTVIVSDIEPSSIGLETITNIPLGSSQLISYSLLERNVDVLDIVWDSDPKNDSSSQIERISIYPGDEKTSVFFSIANANNNSTQTFTSKDPNACFTLFAKNLSFKFDSTYADLTPFINDNEKFKRQFYFYNYDTLNSLKANSIRVLYSPVIYPIYLFCAIVCFDSEFPADEEILGAADKNWFYQNYVNSDKRIEFEFSKLMKNTQYKLKCIAQTTQANIRERSQVVVEILQLNLKEDSGYVIRTEIRTAKMPDTRCIRFRFQKKLGNIVRDALLNFCQNFYKTYSGCIVCLDNTKRNSLGINPGTFYGCNLNEGNKNIQIIDERNIIDGPLTLKSDESIEYSVFTMCPVQDLFCPSTLSAADYEKSVYDLLQYVSSDAMISSNIRLPYMQLKEATVITDATKPNIDSLSLAVVSSEEKGFYSFQVANPTAVYCYYSIFITNILLPPSVDDVLYCQDNARCGIAKVNSEASLISAKKDNIRIFSNGRYSVWFVCYNDLPNPVTRSALRKVGEFIINAYKKPISNSDASFIARLDHHLGILFIFLMFGILL